VFGRTTSGIAALPLWTKALFVLIALGLSVLLSPLVAVLAFLILAVAIFALTIRLIRRRPLRNWGIIALASLLLIILFGGITSALYGGGGQVEQASPP
jgi:energy-coupling factor transporter transmembrane protein EcfT